MEKKYLFCGGSFGENDRVMHLVVVVDFHEVGCVGDGVTSEIRRHTLKEVLVGRDARTDKCGVVDVEEDMQNGHHSARIILNLHVHTVHWRIPEEQR